MKEHVDIVKVISFEWFSYCSGFTAYRELIKY